MRYYEELEFGQQGNYVMVPKGLIQTLSPAEALLLAAMSNIACMKDREHETEDGWFECANERIESEIGFKKNRVGAAMSSLERAGVVETDHRGSPPKRWVLINKVRLKDWISNCWKTSPLSAGKPVLSTYKRKTNKKNSSPRKVAEGSRVSKKTKTRCQFMSTRLAKAIQIGQNRKSIPEHTKWWIYFTKIPKKYGVTLGMVGKVVSWYCRELKKGWVHIISEKRHHVLSGSGMLKKFGDVMGQYLADNPEETKTSSKWTCTSEQDGEIISPEELEEI